MGQLTRHERILPERLRPGDTIGIVSPSWFSPDVMHRVERGIAKLQSLGFKTRIGEHALCNHGFVSDTPERRAADLHGMFRDPAVRMIIATIGGDHACHLLPLLDWDLIRAHPKILLGFSDITVLNVAIWTMTGLVTFNGPTLMTEWAEFPEMPAYSEQLALRLLMEPEPFGPLPRSDWWTEEFLDWRTHADLVRPRQRHPSEGWTWLRHGKARGRLIGGCLESLQHLRGTRYWPDLSSAVLFLETSELTPDPSTVDAMLMDYENMGVFAQLSGLLVARPYGYDDAARHELHEIIRHRTARFTFPVVAGMEFGHTSPMMTLPVGCVAEIDGEREAVRIIESAVR